MSSQTLIEFPVKELNGLRKLGPYEFQHYVQAGKVYYQGLGQAKLATTLAQVGLGFDIVVELGVWEEVQVV